MYDTTFLHKQTFDLSEVTDAESLSLLSNMNSCEELDVGSVHMNSFSIIGGVRRSLGVGKGVSTEGRKEATVIGLALFLCNYQLCE